MRRALRRVLTAWLAWLLLMMGVNLATPLYAVYADQFHFSSLVLTATFATYAVVLVPSLILLGRLSDRIAFARVSLTAGVVWATLALFLSIVPSYTGAILKTKNLALLAAVAALALLAAARSTVGSRRRRRSAPSRASCAPPFTNELTDGTTSLAS